MSVVTSLTVVPNRVVQMWRYLLRFDSIGLSKDDLAHAFSPPGVGKSSQEDDAAGGDIFKEVLKESVALGLVSKMELGELESYVAGVEPPTTGISEAKLMIWIKDYLLEMLSTPGKARSHGQENLPLSLTWLLLQDPITPLKWGESHRSKIDEMFPNHEAFDLTVHARFQNFIYWAWYLGLCTVVGDSSAKLIIPDPTQAIFRLLPHIFSDQQECSGVEFLDRLGQLCPVLEHGEARNELEGLVDSQIMFPKSDALSKSTSLAVLRLEARGLLQLLDVSDAHQTVILSLNPENSKRISHVRYLGGVHAI